MLPLPTNRIKVLRRPQKSPSASQRLSLGKSLPYTKHKPSVNYTTRHEDRCRGKLHLSLKSNTDLLADNSSQTLLIEESNPPSRENHSLQEYKTRSGTTTISSYFTSETSIGLGKLESDAHAPNQPLHLKLSFNAPNYNQRAQNGNNMLKKSSNT